MAKNTPNTDPPDTTVTMIAGKNKPVNNVVKIEDLMQTLKQGAAALPQRAGAAQTGPPDPLASIAGLAAELEKRLRAARRAASSKATTKATTKATSKASPKRAKRKA